MNKKIIWLQSFILLLLPMAVFSSADTVQRQGPWTMPEVKLKFNQEGSRFFQFNMVLQVWNRYNESNPGSLSDGKDKPYTFDIGLRRLRLWTIARPLEWMTLAVQFGINNFNSLSPRKAGDFFHDAFIEFNPYKEYISVGTGLVSSMGHARYSSPAVGSLLAYDAPLFEQSTNDVSDQFLRKLSIYVRGQIKGFDYRIALVDPMSVKNSPILDTGITTNSKFSPLGKSLQYSAYMMYQFFDHEKQLVPYFAGTYLGAKKILNVGAGVEFQPNATWRRNDAGDTAFHYMLIASADFFVDMPLRAAKDDALTAYAVYSYMDFGKGYLRSIGVMNPAQSADPLRQSLSGAGNSYPMIGTGHTLYLQAGYKLPSSFFGKRGFTIQPYADLQASRFDRLNGWVHVFDAGLNFLLIGHKAKLSLNYQNRPVFGLQSLKQESRRSALILQWQMAL